MIVLTLPPVNPKLHSHNKGHWRTKQKAVRGLRELACGLALEARPRDFRTWIRAVVEYSFYVPDRRRRDMANMIHSQKAAIDGVVDARIITDDDWQHLWMGKVECRIDRSNPRVELVFRERS